jgi:hypothetical protein
MNDSCRTVDGRRQAGKILDALGGADLEQLAEQLMGLIRGTSTGSEPPRLKVFLNEHGELDVRCMPRPACDVVVEDIAACLDRCRIHRRHINNHRRELALGDAPRYRAAFEITLEEENEKLKGVHFGTPAEPGLRSLLGSLVLEVDGGSPVGGSEPRLGERALEVWREKLDFYLAERAKRADPATQFQLDQDIKESEDMIRRLSALDHET